MKTMLFNPYTGTPRHPSDISSDPEGILILDPDAPLRAAQPPSQPERKPMSEHEISIAYRTSSGQYLRPQDAKNVRAMVRAVEAFHDIKETP